jgi:dTDP-4-dehydrorhamnose reductase
MNMRTILIVGLVIGTLAPYGALASPLSKIGSDQYSQRFIAKASCDIHDDDKQARCMQACDDTWIKATQAYNAKIDQAKTEKKACETKCGC